jgi:hypothetical protein
MSMAKYLIMDRHVEGCGRMLLRQEEPHTVLQCGDLRPFAGTYYDGQPRLLCRDHATNGIVVKFIPESTGQIMKQL